MEAIRFILENPSSERQQRKRARLVTACDSCRVKKIKCLLPSGGAQRCEACTMSKTTCSFGDRDRYQAERGGLPSPPPCDNIPIPSPFLNVPIKRKDPPTPPSDSSTPSSLSSDPQATLPTPPWPPVSPESAPSPMRASLPPVDPKGLREPRPSSRHFGPTALVPGTHPVEQRLPVSPESASMLMFPMSTNDSVPLSPASYFPSLVNASNLISPSYPSYDLFDSLRPDYPNHLTHLTPIFFHHLRCHFPFLDQSEVSLAVQSGTISPLLANCICALAVRFSDRPDLNADTNARYKAGDVFCQKAKQLAFQSLSHPSLELVQCLILISWADYGGSGGREGDSGLWMDVRIAIAMAIDIGLGNESATQAMGGDSEEAKERIRLTWWSVVLLDGISSWGSGRSKSIDEDEFDTALPASGLMPLDSDDFASIPPRHFLFGHLTKMCLHRAAIGDALNNRGRKNQSSQAMEESILRLEQLFNDMTVSYQSLPSTLAYDIPNFHRFSQHHQGALFLLLHVMYHSTALAVLQTQQSSNSISNILHIDNSTEASRFVSPSVSFLSPPPISQFTNPLAALQSARSISDILTVADELNLQAYFNNPFLDIPIFIAARAFIKEREDSPTYNPPTELEKCKEVLRKMSKFWGGAGHAYAILEQECITRLRGQRQHSRDQSADRHSPNNRRRNSSTLATATDGSDPRAILSHGHRSSFDHHHHHRASHSERGVKAEPASPPSSYNHNNWFSSIETGSHAKHNGQQTSSPNHLNNALGMSLKSAKAVSGVGFGLGFGFGFNPSNTESGGDGLGGNGSDFGTDPFGAVGGWKTVEQGVMSSSIDSASTGGFLGMSSQW